MSHQFVTLASWKGVKSSLSFLSFAFPVFMIDNKSTDAVELERVYTALLVLGPWPRSDDINKPLLARSDFSNEELKSCTKQLSSALLFNTPSALIYCVLLLVCGLVTTWLFCDSFPCTFKFLPCTQHEFHVSIIFLYTNIYLLNIFKKYLCGI